MKWYEGMILYILAAYVGGCFVGDIGRRLLSSGTPASRSPLGLQNQIESVREDISKQATDIRTYRKEQERMEEYVKLLMLRTEHLDSDEFAKAIKESTDWRMNPETRKSVLLNHRESLLTRLNAIRQALEENRQHTEWTENEIKRKQETVEAEIKALPPKPEAAPKRKPKPKPPAEDESKPEPEQPAKVVVPTPKLDAAPELPPR